jgi:hypothetical protein
VRRSVLLALVALAASAGMIESASARDYDSRQQERREAIVAGVVRHEIASDRAEEHYRECMRGSRYDTDCDRRRYEEEQEARRKGRRTAVVVGALN